MRTGIEFAAPSNWSEVEGGWPESIEDIGGWPVLGSIRLPLSVFPSKRLRRLETLLVADELFPSSVGDNEVFILLNTPSSCSTVTQVHPNLSGVCP